MKIALWNASGLNNLGDRVLDRANREQLSSRLPGAEFVTFCPWANGATKELFISSEGNWPGLNEFDAIVVGGGALLMGPPFSHPGLQCFFFGSTPSKFQDRASKIWNAMCSDTQFLAPLQDNWREFVKDAVDQVSYCTVRNERSKEFLEDCGASSEIKVVPDPAVLLETPDKRLAFAHSGRARPRIGVSIARPVFTTEFISYMTSTALRRAAPTEPGIVCLRDFQHPDFDEEQFALRWSKVLSQMGDSADIQIVGLGPMYGDPPVAARVSSNLAQAPLISLDNDEDAFNWIRSLDCLVAGRLHHCIVAFALGVPFVAVDPYFNPITGTSKLHQFVCGLGHPQLYSQLDHFLSGSDNIRSLIDAALVAREGLSERHRLAWQDSMIHFDQVAECCKQGLA